MDFNAWIHLLEDPHSVRDVLTLATLCWMFWITRQIVDIRERLSKLSGELEVIRNNRKVVLGG